VAPLNAAATHKAIIVRFMITLLVSARLRARRSDLGALSRLVFLGIRLSATTFASARIARD